MESTSPVPRQLRVAVIASLIIISLGLAGFATHLLPFESLYVLFLPGGVIAFVAGLCGAFYGFAILFKVHGFYRWVAILSALISLYAIIRCAGFFGWAINLP
jgi:hypothetical protein